jgi:hypothetical protein
MSFKHIGLLNNKHKVVVAYRTLPGDALSALVIPTAPLPTSYHDELMKVVESGQGQDAFELATQLSVRKFADGLNMLGALHAQKYLTKVSTESVTMTPTHKKESFIRLDELNKIIAEQRGVSIGDLAVSPNPESTKSALNKTALSDEKLAQSYRNQADLMYKEVVELRRKADELNPPATKSIKTKKTDKVDA